jgi:Glycosyltransferase family 87
MFGPMRARATRYLLALAALAGILGIGYACVSKQVRTGTDFPLYYAAARTLLAGGTPYDVTSGLHGYVYLPFFALLLAPLASMPLAAAAAVWYAANVIFIAASIAGTVRLARAGEASRLSAWLAVAALVPLLGLFHDNLVLGQANLFLLILVVTAIAGLLEPKARIAPGFLLGLAAALKMNAALLVVPLMIRGRVRPLLGFAAGIGFAVLAPLAVLGPARGLELMAEWRAKVVIPAAQGTLQGSKIWDQSPQAALRRLLVDAPAYGDTRVNVATISPASVARVGRVVGAGIFLALLLVWLRSPSKGLGDALLLDLGMACCGVLQVVGFNLKAQFVLLLLPGMVAASRAFGVPRRGGRGTRLGILLAGLLLLLSNPGLAGRAVSNVALSYSSMAVATLIIVVVLARLRHDPLDAARPLAKRDA